MAFCNHTIGKLKSIQFPTWFLLVAILLQCVYLANFRGPLLYKHGAQRFFHVAHLAETLLGRPDSLPSSFLTLLAGSAPKSDAAFANAACDAIPEPDHTKYCWDKPPTDNVLSFTQLLDIPLDPGEQFPFRSRPEAAHYSPLGYLPYLLPVLLSLCLNVPPAFVLYASVVFSAFLGIALSAYIIRIIPVLRWPLCFLVLMPSSCDIRALVMPDALAMELSFLLLALTLKYRYQPTLLNRRQKNGLLALAVAVGLVKTVFFLTPLAYALIPAQCFASKRDKTRFISIAFAASVIAAMSWNIYAMMAYYPAIAPNHLYYFFTHPVDSISVIYSPFYQPHLLAQNILGDMLVWYRYGAFTDLQVLISLLPLALAVLTEYTPDPKMAINAREKCLCSGIFVLSWGVIMIAMLAHIGNSITLHTLHLIGVVQGRYVVPVLPYLLLAGYSIIKLPGRALPYMHILVYSSTIASLAYLHYRYFVF